MKTEDSLPSQVPDSQFEPLPLPDTLCVGLSESKRASVETAWHRLDPAMQQRMIYHLNQRLDPELEEIFEALGSILLRRD